MPKKISSEKFTKDVRKILENPLWINEILPDKLYSRIEDDCDGDYNRKLSVLINRYGDAWVDIGTSFGSSLRYRTFGGGGRSPRTRAALMILVYAIILDNKEVPDPV